MNKEKRNILKSFKDQFSTNSLKTVEDPRKLYKIDRTIIEYYPSIRDLKTFLEDDEIRIVTSLLTTHPYLGLYYLIQFQADLRAEVGVTLIITLEQFKSYCPVGLKDTYIKVFQYFEQWTKNIPVESESHQSEKEDLEHLLAYMLHYLLLYTSEEDNYINEILEALTPVYRISNNHKVHFILWNLYKRYNSCCQYHIENFRYLLNHYSQLNKFEQRIVERDGEAYLIQEYLAFNNEKIEGKRLFVQDLILAIYIQFYITLNKQMDINNICGRIVMEKWGDQLYELTR